MYAAWRDKGAIGPCEQREVRCGFDWLPTHLLFTLLLTNLPPTYCLLRCGRAASMRCAGGASRRVLARSSSR